MQKNDSDTVKQFSGEEEEIKSCVGGLVELEAQIATKLQSRNQRKLNRSQIHFIHLTCQ